MPDHIHLLISEPERGNPSRVMQAIKQGFARRVLKSLRRRRVAAQTELFTVAAEHVWQKRFYDFNVFTARKRIEKLRYMHQKSRETWIGAGTRAVALEQLSELCFRGAGCRADQSVGRSQDQNPEVGCMNSHLYKKRKGGPALPSTRMPEGLTGAVTDEFPNYSHE